MNRRTLSSLPGYLVVAAVGWLVCQPLPAQTTAPAKPASSSSVQPILGPNPTQPNSSQLAPAAAGSPMAAAPEEDIRDIRGPVPLPSIWPLIAWIAGSLFALTALVLLWRWWRARRKTARIKPLHELALEELEAARRFMSPEQAREFSIAVSEAVRRYIELRFGVHAPRKTTEEFLHMMVKQNGADLGPHQALLQDFLRHCDLAKFARWTLSVPEMESMLASGRTFIESTTPEAMAHAAVASLGTVPPPAPEKEPVSAA